MEEHLNAKLEQLKNIYESLIIVKADGKSYLREGVTKNQAEYVLEEFDNIGKELRQLKEKQAKTKKNIKKIKQNINVICNNARPRAEKLMEMNGENFLPSWFKKYLDL